jgi:hypothetical protein
MIDQITERLRKLLLMLSSDRDGEVVAAARSIGRALRGNGSDWHDLASRLLVPVKVQARRDARHDRGNWHEMRDYCIKHDVLLRSREHEFITSLGEWRGDLTEKQYDWLVAICERLRRASK